MIVEKVLFYKYGFWIFLISTITLLNLWHLTKSGYEYDNIKSKKVDDKRIISLMTSNIYLKRRIKSFEGKNIITDEANNNLLKGPIIAILLAEFKCNKCQEKELKRLDSLSKKMRLKGVDIIGITTLAKKNTVAIQRKILKLNFPIYWVDNEFFYKGISFTNEYPQIIYINDNIIQSALSPIPLDNEFSEIYYEYLLKNL